MSEHSVERMELRGEAAIVTGSATGIGRSTALDLARRGCNVVINYTRNEAEARNTGRDTEARNSRLENPVPITPSPEK